MVYGLTRSALFRVVDLKPQNKNTWLALSRGP